VGPALRALPPGPQEHRGDGFGGRRIGSRIRAIGQDFESERPLLTPLPGDAFETGLVLTPRVDRYGQVMVRNNRYSVPSRLIGRQVRVVLRSSELAVFYRSAEVARHPRLTAKGGERLVLGHYLEALMRKPGPCPDRPPWTRPARPGRSPRPTRRSGRRPAGLPESPPRPAS